MRKYLVALGLSMVMTNQVSADALQIQLGDEFARILYSNELFAGSYGPVDLEIGGTFTDNDAFLANVGLIVRNDTVEGPLVVAVGSRLYYVNIDGTPQRPSADVWALTIGGELMYFPETWGGLGFGGYLFGAPKITTFADGNSLLEYGVKLDYRISPQTSIMIGYEKVETEIDKAGTFDVDVVDGAYIGINLRF